MKFSKIPKGNFVIYLVPGNQNVVAVSRKQSKNILILGYAEANTQEVASFEEVSQRLAAFESAQFPKQELTEQDLEGVETHDVTDNHSKGKVIKESYLHRALSAIFPALNQKKLSKLKRSILAVCT